MLWTELRVLIVDTGRVWWRLLPIIIGVYLLGWLGSELSLRVAVILGDISPWLTLIMFAFSFVCTLAAAIVILTLAGRELGIRQLLPEDEREIDDRDTSIIRLLGITLLPFLGMYAAFGQVAEAAQRLISSGFAMAFSVISKPSLAPCTTWQPSILAGSSRCSLAFMSLADFSTS
ncbi:MAG TPA: hypothetical protein VIQ76_19395 [Propionibacteriaceae bacterium]